MSIPCMLGKDCNANPISTFPPCMHFRLFSLHLPPRLIQSISRNVHNNVRALKQLWHTSLISLLQSTYRITKGRIMFFMWSLKIFLVVIFFLSIFGYRGLLNYCIFLCEPFSLPLFLSSIICVLFFCWNNSSIEDYFCP